ncbi:DUF2189 domain-containing protein [Methylobacterium sp. J-068]|uniref:DUF2189 domain-containing protein n=1 Tax=Methylobacterium sp. J-068 TaxID=2836649 RepID=UPI001FB8F1F1|nr:DUF2189 domain-containing protein [Methylobacterium sp. J-068]MCJ2034313.1 DUF2189 domain-containing protein [Methylobacterium sp. J-068]
MTTLHADQFHHADHHRHGMARPVVNAIDARDLSFALRRGWDDFQAMPTHALFIGLIYPLIGLVLATVAFGTAVLPLVFPLAAGFALIGPFAAVGLYELSRRRERGLPADWAAAFSSLNRTAAGALAGIGLLLTLIFACWLVAAQGIYWGLYGDAAPDSLLGFARDVLTTPRGWALIAIGNLVGFAFSLAVLAISVVSVPMLVDRRIDTLTAIETSLAAFRRNPLTLTAWGFVVAGLLVLGSLPLFVGLAVVMPILGHATWHLYRRIVPA